MITFHLELKFAPHALAMHLIKKPGGRVKEPVGCTCNHGMTPQKAPLPKNKSV